MPDYPKCLTCKHWSRPGHRWACHKLDQQLGECHHPTQSHRRDSGPLVIAVNEDAMAYAEIITDANFGCILHSDLVK